METAVSVINSELLILETQITNIQNDIETIFEDFNALVLGPRIAKTATIVYLNGLLKAGTPLALTPNTAGIQIPIAIVMTMDYGGSNPFTNAPPVTIFWTNPGATAAYQDLDTDSTFWQATEDSVHMTTISGRQNIVKSDWVDGNNQIRIQPQSALTGNAANNNTVTVTLYWYEINPY